MFEKPNSESLTKLPVPDRAELEAYVRQVATAYHLDPNLAVLQCQAESSFNPAAVSHCGAVGLFQLMPNTAAQLGVDPHDWKENVIGWADYMAQLQRLFNGNYDQMLAAYNWGMGHVRLALTERGANWKSALPKETADYLQRILGQSAPGGKTTV